MGISFCSLSRCAPHSSSSLNSPPHCSGSTNTDRETVGFSVTKRNAGKSQLSEMASGSFDGEGSLLLPLLSPNGHILEWSNLKVFTFAELKSATQRFRTDTLLGEGRYGRVYKGWLDEKTLTPTRVGSGIAVAVKKIDTERWEGFGKWQSAVNVLGRLSHPNLVNLLGYCWDDEKLLLVYEFMQKGSLENHLFRRNPDIETLSWNTRIKIAIGAARGNIEPLSWNTRIKIAIGAARGLAFLHASEKKLMFERFNASHILLDGNYNAKISDFGLVKLGPPWEDKDKFVYVAPEWCIYGHLFLKAGKSDVYGFGVVLLEMLTGMPAMDTTRPKGQKNLVEWMETLLSNKIELDTIMDAKIEGQYSQEAASQALQLSLKCLDYRLEQRPSMKDVLEALEVIEAIQVNSTESQNLN